MEEKILRQLKNLSETLCELRENSFKEDGKRYTQQDIASLLNISYQSYQAYERGVAYPTLQNFLKLAEIYDVSLDFLVGKSDL